MKTLLARMKTALIADTTLSEYVTEVQVVAPGSIPPLSQNIISFIGLAPITSPEAWKAQKKEVIHTVEAYLVTYYTVLEDAIIGTDNSKGMLDFISDFENVVRANFFPDDSGNYYLSKPTDITNVEYTTANYGENFYLLIATVTMLCPRLFP